VSTPERCVIDRSNGSQASRRLMRLPIEEAMIWILPARAAEIPSIGFSAFQRLTPCRPAVVGIIAPAR